MASATLAVNFIGHTEKLRGALRHAEGQTAPFGSKVESAGRKMTVFASVPIVAFLGNATRGASDLNEAVSKVDTVFGTSAATIHDFATSAAQNIGLSRVAAESAAGGFGNMFTQIGVTTE